MLTLLQVACMVLAIAAWLVPLPAALVERTFAAGLYPAIQAALTSLSNMTRLPLVDGLGVALVGLAVVVWMPRLRAAVTARRVAPIAGALWTTAAVAAVLYLWFLGAWGLNYRRVAIDARPGFDEALVTGDAVHRLAVRAIAEVNRRHDGAHRAGFAPVDAVPEALVRALHDVERRLGRPRPTVPARPKRSLLVPFFRAAGVDGMLAPFALETLLNPDLTGPERPVVLAHEWAHLSGYAPEDEASFVGVLVALAADEPSQYSAWLSLVFDTTALLPTEERRALLGTLAEGPRRDQEAIVARLLRRVDVVQRTSWSVYDGYLKSQGVEEGLQSYGGVVRLLLGTGSDPSAETATLWKTGFPQ